MKRKGVLFGATAVAAVALAAQQAQAPTPVAVGTDAPDFTLPSATKAGVGKPITLRDFRGKTVVLAFFYKARTGG
jgi:cytochrome oxidase Cu insertion factor (SCO1/SenC/PrrC family)